jgi:hypothetical protein
MTSVIVAGERTPFARFGGDFMDLFNKTHAW